MDNRETVTFLKTRIKENLRSVISKRCVLVDIPYYQNIGDVLIWEGEKDFLKDIGSNCIYAASYWTFTFPDYDENVTILFSGGGNLGDLYPEHIEFLIKIVHRYPNNRIVVLPQTVYYKDKIKEENHLRELNRHKDLVFCARDKKVAEDVSRYIDNVVTVPDMAFYNDMNKLEKYKMPTIFDRLIIKRDDDETGTDDTSVNGDIADWPTLAKGFRTTTIVNKVLYTMATKGIIFRRFWDWYFQTIHSSLMLKEGVRFISPYKEIETTRLHGCILSILLNKKVSLIDNSYGKNSEFYKSWLVMDEDVTLK